MPPSRKLWSFRKDLLPSLPHGAVQEAAELGALELEAATNNHKRIRPANKQQARAVEAPARVEAERLRPTFPNIARFNSY